MAYTKFFVNFLQRMLGLLLILFVIFAFLPDILSKMQNTQLWQYKYNIYSYSWSLYSYLFPKIKTKSVISVYSQRNIGENNRENFELMNVYLEIPRLKIYGKVLEGNNEDVMNHGFWHYPNGADFNNLGNIVIIGHRYLKIPPAKDTFYNLDKVQKGDIVLLHTKYGDWKFVVNEIKIIDKSDISVLSKGDKFQLTVFTCHPLWSSRQRLVVIALPIDKSRVM